MAERSSFSILADLGSKLALPKIKESLKNITTGKESDGFLNALANNLNAKLAVGMLLLKILDLQSRLLRLLKMHY